MGLKLRHGLDANYSERTDGEAFAEGEASAGHSQVYPQAEPASPFGVSLPAKGVGGNFVHGNCPCSGTIITGLG